MPDLPEITYEDGEWRLDGKPLDEDQREYLRLSALMAEALVVPPGWPLEPAAEEESDA